MENDTINMPEKYVLYNLKVYATKKNQDNFVAIKQKMSKKEKEEKRYEVVTENEDGTSTGLKYLTKQDLSNVGVENVPHGEMYNLTFIKDEEKYKLDKADKVKLWTDIVQLTMSDVRYTKEKKAPFVVLYHSVKEETFDQAPNKEKFVEGMKGMGLDGGSLEPNNGWINFNAFVWLNENDIERVTKWKKAKKHWSLQYEQINEEPAKIKRVFGPAFEKELLVEARVENISENKKEATLIKETNYEQLRDHNLLSLQQLAEVINVPRNEKEFNITLKFKVKIDEPTEVKEGDIVEFFLNDQTVKKLKSTAILLKDLETVNNPFNQSSNSEEDHSRDNVMPEIEIAEDDIPF